jgi:hypothetical protein
MLHLWAHAYLRMRQFLFMPTKRTYKLEEGNLQHQFLQSRAKIRIFGGGFANGKTTAGVILALQLAKEYPGSNGLIARSTYPKLNDTIRKEFLAWCPNSWITRKNLSQENVVELSNGTVINFRYIAQQGKNAESTTSNLLSATYDWIVVDQMEDPEITHKDFLDLLGRLRGSAAYIGEDESMPRSGPRWFIILCNPTRNWVYKRLVKPLIDLKIGLPNPDLLVDEDGEPIIELFEGPTHSNAANLEPDYIATLESTYTGQMRERYLLGQWGAFEGLVYPTYDAQVHMLDRSTILNHLDKLLERGYEPTWVESYDHGIASPSCYSIGFVDDKSNVFDLAGFYEKEKTIEQLAALIKEKRAEVRDAVGDVDLLPVLADPAIFKRTSGTSRTVGVSVAGMFAELGIKMTRANNDIVSGIAKVQAYLGIDAGHVHPITGSYGSPRLFFCTDQHWIDDEFVDYIWKRDNSGEYEDKPMDRADHAMDRIKYMLTNRPRIALFKPVKPNLPPKYMRWSEFKSDEATRNLRKHRHAA